MSRLLVQPVDRQCLATSEVSNEREGSGPLARSWSRIDWWKRLLASIHLPASPLQLVPASRKARCWARNSGSRSMGR